MRRVIVCCIVIVLLNRSLGSPIIQSGQPTGSAAADLSFGFPGTAASPAETNGNSLHEQNLSRPKRQWNFLGSAVVQAIISGVKKTDLSTWLDYISQVSGWIGGGSKKDDEIQQNLRGVSTMAESFIDAQILGEENRQQEILQDMLKKTESDVETMGHTLATLNEISQDSCYFLAVIIVIFCLINMFLYLQYRLVKKDIKRQNSRN